MMMMMMLFCFVLTSAPILATVAAEDECSYPQACGDLSAISYPFSIYPSCGLPEFHLDCRIDNSRSPTPNKLYAFLNTMDSELQLQVLKISAESLLVDGRDMQVTAAALNCSAGTDPAYSSIVLPGFPGPYLFSNSNTFMTWNCGVGGYYAGVHYRNGDFSPTFLPNDKFAIGICWSDCVSSRPNSCSFPSSPIKPDEGQDYATCCSAPITHPTRGLAIFANASSNSSAPCSVFANFLSVDEYKPDSTTFPLKLDWAIPYNKSFNATDMRSDPSFACSDNNSRIIINAFVPGYRCACLDGFTGDGYKNATACRDFDECAEGTYKCDHYTSCKNTPGTYVCVCQFRCLLLNHIIVLAAAPAVAILAMILLAMVWNKWKQRQKFRFFVNNGGLQLEALMGGGADQAAKLYSIEELQEATNNFSPSNKLGAGGYGIVYKGVLKKDNGRIVAIKKARHYSSEEAGDRQSFLNEMAILTHINHRHIVRMFGCCVETRLPLLVYEYVSHGNLAEWLHQLETPYLPWNYRVKIAIQAGSALAYLHSAAFPPILHRDVKSANILLDENMDAKVADFGASRLIPDEQSQVSTAVQGTLGYIDPEYIQTMQLTEKSDVYGFGVVLAELLTAVKPIDHKRHGNNVSLAWMLVNMASEGNIMEIVDPLVLQNESAGLEEAIVRVAEIAVSCLAMLGEKRPSMREVVEELYAIKDLQQSMEPLIPPYKGFEGQGKLISTPNVTASFLLTGR